MKQLILLTLLLLNFIWAQDVEMPLQQTLSSASEITALIQKAQTTLFLATPILSPGLEAELMAAAGRGVNVYFVTLKENPRIRGLTNAGVQVRTLSKLADGVLLADKTLVAGGLLRGAEGETLQIDTSRYGTTVTDQLMGVWQIAKP
jgi:hypothetical protein